jgi:hypothetical protein
MIAGFEVDEIEMVSSTQFALMRQKSRAIGMWRLVALFRSKSFGWIY